MALELMPYLSTIIGFLVVYVLNGIKAEIKEIKNSVNNLEKDIRDDIAKIDHRVTKVELRCSHEHDGQLMLRRRASDPIPE